MTKEIFSIDGRVVDTMTGRGVQGLRVEAWDKARVYDDSVGSAISDEQGAFQIQIDQSYFRELFQERRPDLYFKIFREQDLVKSTEDSVIWNVEAGETELTIKLVLVDPISRPPLLAALKLRYEILTYIDICEHVPESICERFEAWKDSTEATFTYARNRVMIERGGQQGLTLVLDLTSDAILLIDHHRKEFAIVEQKPEALKQLTDMDQSLQISRPGIRRRGELNQNEVTLERLDVILPGFPFEVWVIEKPLRSKAVARVFWPLLLPGASELLISSGLPAEIVVRDPKHWDTIWIRIRLIDWEEIPDLELPMTPPESYEKMEPERIEFRGGSAELNAEGDGADGSPIEASGFKQKARREHAEYRTQTMMDKHKLRAQGQDFAWIMDQSFLDQIRNIINTISGTFGNFSGDGMGGSKPMHVNLNWWAQLEPHLRFTDGSGADITDDVLRALKRLWLYYQIMQDNSPDGSGLLTIEEDPHGLTPAEEDIYRRVLTDAADGARCGGLSESACRVLLFRNAFTVSRIEELAEAHFDDLTGPEEFDLDVSVIRRDFNIVRFRAKDFDTEIVIDGEPIIEELAFKDDTVPKIALVLRLKRFYTDFQFETFPSSGISSVLCNLFSLGACSLLQFNWGWGYLSVDDAKLVCDITPAVSGGAVQLLVSVNQDASVMEPDIVLLPANPVSFPIFLIISAIVSWFAEDVLNAEFYPKIQDSIENLLTEKPFRWPEIWHALNGPSIRGTAALFLEDSGILEGEASPARIPGFFAAIDPSTTEALGYAFSARYLTEWLYELIPLVDGSTLLPVDDVEERLGIILPDPATLPGAGARPLPPIAGRLPGIGCDPALAPPVPPPDLFNQQTLVRSAPVVELPEPGLSGRAGKVVIVYELRIEVIRRDFVAIQIYIEESCVPIGDFSGAPRIEGEGRISFRRLSARGLTNRQIALRQFERVILGGFEGRPVPNRPPFEEGLPLSPGRLPVPPGRSPEDLPEFYCLPPYCDWRIEHRDSVLTAYLTANVRVAGELLLGFNERSTSMWLPEIMLSIAGLQDREPQLEAEITAIAVEDPFTNVDRETLESFIRELCLTDARSLLAGPTRMQAPATELRLIPDEARIVLGLDGFSRPVRDQVSRLLEYRQSNASGSLSYLSRGHLLYWTIGITENLSRNIV
jgi:hypothetical protein